MSVVDEYIHNFRISKIILEDLYNLKTKCKKMTSNVNDINFMDKQLYNKINAAIDKKNKDSKNYKKKNDEVMFSAL